MERHSACQHNTASEKMLSTFADMSFFLMDVKLLTCSGCNEDMRTLTLHLFGDLCRSPMESRVPFRMAGFHAAGHDSDVEQRSRVR